MDIDNPPPQPIIPTDVPMPAPGTPGPDDPGSPRPYTEPIPTDVPMPSPEPPQDPTVPNQPIEP